jgi:hypothetical protein
MLKINKLRNEARRCVRVAARAVRVVHAAGISGQEAAAMGHHHLEAWIVVEHTGLTRSSAAGVSTWQWISTVMPGAALPRRFALIEAAPARPLGNSQIRKVSAPPSSTQLQASVAS